MFPKALAPGQTVGPYTLLAPLGAGGMAQVFVAQREDADTLCVLKVLHDSVQNSTSARRFQREAHIASLLAHPNIGPVLDAGWHDEKFFLTMPVIDGETVEDLARAAKKRGGLVPTEVSIGIVSTALDALEYAHNLKDSEGRDLHLVHRDLSPRNIMVGYDGRPWLIDFGVAKGELGDFKTATGVLVGTPYYMSPEQAQALPADHRSDLYTVGTVLYELITGERTARGDNQMALLMSVIQRIPVPASTLNPKVPPALDAVLARALAKSRDERFQSASEFRTALLESAGEFAGSTIPQISECVSSYFPEGPARAQARQGLLQAGPSAPNAEPTRAAPSPVIAQPAAHVSPRWPSWLPAAGGLVLLAALGLVLASLSGRMKDAPGPVKVAPIGVTSPSVSSRPVAVTASPTVVPAVLPKQPAPRLRRPSVAPAPVEARPSDDVDKPPSPYQPQQAALRGLRQSKDKPSALRLAKDLQTIAGGLPTEQARRLQVEIDRVYLTSNVDTMIEALGAALALLRK